MTAHALRWVMAALLVVAMAGCQLAAEVGVFSVRCSLYNGSKDGFRMEAVTPTFVGTPGDTFVPKVETDWLNDYYERESLTCSPDWVIADEDVVALQEDGSIRLVGPGLGHVTARVSGAGGVKEAKFEIASLHPPTEEEPNNGHGSADVLIPAERQYGQADYEGDVDYYEFSVPAGRSYQIDVQPQLDQDDSEHFSAYSVPGDILDADGWDVGDKNRTYTNDSMMSLTLWMVIDPYQKGHSYEVTFHLVE